MKKLVLAVVLNFLCIATHAQSLRSDTAFVPSNMRQYQFQLAHPAREVKMLRYELSGEPIRGTLTPDGSRVIMDNYKKGSRIKATIIYADGSQEEITKSSCYIDPVVYDL